MCNSKIYSQDEKGTLIYRLPTPGSAVQAKVHSNGGKNQPEEPTGLPERGAYPPMSGWEVKSPTAVRILGSCRVKDTTERSAGSHNQQHYFFFFPATSTLQGEG